MRYLPAHRASTLATGLLRTAAVALAAALAAGGGSAIAGGARASAAAPVANEVSVARPPDSAVPRGALTSERDARSLLNAPPQGGGSAASQGALLSRGGPAAPAVAGARAARRARESSLGTSGCRSHLLLRVLRV